MYHLPKHLPKPIQEPDSDQMRSLFLRGLRAAKVSEESIVHSLRGRNGRVFNVAKKPSKLLEKKRERAKKRKELALTKGEEIGENDDNDDDDDA